MPKIHPTAIIDPTAQIHDSVQIGAFSIIGKNVVIGKDTILKSHVVVVQDTIIGKRNTIYQCASLGDDCQDLKYKGEQTTLVIGDDNIIRELCSFHRGTAQDNGVTLIGNGNLFMVNTHIAHDCIIGNHNVFANNVGVAGHVVVDDYVVIGGNSGIHQFCRIGSYSMIAAASLIVKDVAPFVIVSGNPAAIKGLNKEGIKRKGWSKQTLENLETAYRTIFRKALLTQEAVLALQPMVEYEPKIQLFIDLLQKSQRGIIR